MLLFLDSIKRPSYSKETSEAKIPHLVTNDDSDSYFDYNYVHVSYYILLGVQSSRHNRLCKVCGNEIQSLCKHRFEGQKTMYD